MPLARRDREGAVVHVGGHEPEIGSEISAAGVDLDEEGGIRTLPLRQQLGPVSRKTIGFEPEGIGKAYPGLQIGVRPRICVTGARSKVKSPSRFSRSPQAG